MLGINLERLIGRWWWLKRSLQIEMVDLRARSKNLVNHGVEGKEGLSEHMLSSCFVVFEAYLADLVVKLFEVAHNV